MKPKDIQVRKTYVNRGAGRTKRKVLAIGDEHRPEDYYNANGIHPNDTGVLFEQNGREYNLYLKSFAQWVGKEAENG